MAMVIFCTSWREQWFSVVRVVRKELVTWNWLKLLYSKKVNLRIDNFKYFRRRFCCHKNIKCWWPYSSCNVVANMFSIFFVSINVLFRNKTFGTSLCGFTLLIHRAFCKQMKKHVSRKASININKIFYDFFRLAYICLHLPTFVYTYLHSSPLV